MTNTEIITKTIESAFDPAQIAALNTAIFTPAQLAARESIMMQPAEILTDAFHTFQEWKRLGYSVRKGEHAALVAYLWKYSNRPTKDQREAAEAAGENPEEAGGGNHFYKCKSFLFSALQVEKSANPPRILCGAAP